MINLFEPFDNDGIIEDNLFLSDPFEGVINKNDTYEDFFPTSFCNHCDFFRESNSNSNRNINEQEINLTNNNTNNNQINDIDNNNNSNNNSNSNNNNNNNNNNNANSSNNNNNSSNNNVNERIPNSGLFNYFIPILPLNIRIKPKNKEKNKNIKDKLTKTKFIKSLYKDQDCCIICLQEFKNNQSIYKLSCNHIFHIRCLNKEIKYRKKCPMCRKKF